MSPEVFWCAGFLSLAIPFVLGLNILFTLHLVLNQRFNLWPILALLGGLGFMYDSFVWSKARKGEADFTLLSYNVRTLQEDYKDKNYMVYSPKMAKWIINDSSEIKCLQEFGDKREATHKMLATGLEKKGYKRTKPVGQGYNTGLVIFTKYPILSQGNVLKDDEIHNRHNGALYADLKVNQDTIRVYNLHLESMGINQKKLTEKKNIFENYKEIGGKLKEGMVARARQSETILTSVKNSPYPVVLCGDFNDPPYSYVYQQYDKQLRNTFTQVGKGFGFTFNGILFFLRIDNQFYSKGIRALTFETLYEVKYSDHFPIKASYNISSATSK